MAYSKLDLERYAATIVEPQDRTEFLSRVTQIPFRSSGRHTEVCSASQLVDAFRGSPVDHLRAAFEEEYLRVLAEGKRTQ